jgi:hypothetical protein
LVADLTEILWRFEWRMRVSDVCRRERCCYVGDSLELDLRSGAKVRIRLVVNPARLRITLPYISRDLLAMLSGLCMRDAPSDQHQHSDGVQCPLQAIATYGYML